MLIVLIAVTSVSVVGAILVGNLLLERSAYHQAKLQSRLAEIARRHGLG
jgi:ABC-type Mn2+/Zn2+ transport system permease subunit